MERGFLKLYLSYPIDRRWMFLAKLLSPILILTAIGILSIIAAILIEFLPIVDLFPYVMKALPSILLAFLIQLIFIVSVSTSISLLIRGLGPSLMLSLVILYVPYTIPIPCDKFPYVPPLLSECLILEILSPLTAMQKVLSITLPCIGFCLILLWNSYLHFTRRLVIT